MTKLVPDLKSDLDAEVFLDQDLSDLDFSQFKPSAFEFEAKTARVNMRMPASLLDDVKAKAERAGIPYQRFIRQALENAVDPDNRPRGRKSSL